MKQLSEDHSEIRLSAFQVMVEIFERSHSFRNIVVDSLQELFVLILETEPSRGLPPPKEAKKRLKSLSISTIESWVKTYGDTYRFVTCFILTVLSRVHHLFSVYYKMPNSLIFLFLTLLNIYIFIAPILTFRKLYHAYNFLRQVKKVTFNELDARNEIER